MLVNSESIRVNTLDYKYAVNIMLTYVTITVRFNRNNCRIYLTERYSNYDDGGK